MITPENKKLLEELNRSQYGYALKTYLNEKYAEIGNILDTQTWEETQGRKFALVLLKDLFYFMEEKKNSQEKVKNQYE